MGKLLDLAKGLAGEKSLHGRFGRWIQAVSTALDGGAATPDYGIAKKGAVLATIGQGDVIPLELVGLTRGVTYDEAHFLWVLTPGKTYLLHGEGYFDSFSDPVNGSLDVAWVDAVGTPLVGGGINSPENRFEPQAQSGSVSMIYTVPFGDIALTTARLYCTLATGTAAMVQGFWSSTVLQIP